MKSEPITKSKRRVFLKQVATLAGSTPFAPKLIASTGLVVSTAAVAPAVAQTMTATVTGLQVGYESLSSDEAGFVEAMVNVMCPADNFTPNGVDCGLAVFIDRQLAGGFGKGERLYMRGPWRMGKPQLGYQLPLTPEQFFKLGVAAANSASKTKFGKKFDELPPADGDAFLQDIAGGKIVDERVPLASWFNDLVYPLFTQACFADPIYGGNNAKVFWKMIGYPGLPATHTQDMVAFRGRPYPGAKDPKSIADFS